MLSLAGCGSSTQKELEHDEDSMKQATEIMISSMSQMDESTFEKFRELSDYGLSSTLYETGLPIQPEEFIGVLNAWEAGVKDCGRYIGHGDLVVEASNTEVKIKTQAQFEEKDASLEFVFNEKGNMENLTFGIEYTMGEILKKAGLNTLIGMGTVFVVLIFIAFVISLFKFIPVIQSKFAKKKDDVIQEVVDSPRDTKTEIVETAEEVDDLELIAVISAAIAQNEETTTDGFVVRSIKRRTNNKWNGGK